MWSFSKNGNCAEHLLRHPNKISRERYPERLPIPLVKENLSLHCTPDDVRRKCALLDSHCASVGRPTVSVLRTFTNVELVALVADARAAGRRHERWNGSSGRAENEWFAGTPDQAVAYFSSLMLSG
jgi:hypothetical protein